MFSAQSETIAQSKRTILNKVSWNPRVAYARVQNPSAVSVPNGFAASACVHPGGHRGKLQALLLTSRLSKRVELAALGSQLQGESLDYQWQHLSFAGLGRVEGCPAAKHAALVQALSDGHVRIRGLGAPQPGLGPTSL